MDSKSTKKYVVVVVVVGDFARAQVCREAALRYCVDQALSVPGEEVQAGAGGGGVKWKQVVYPNIEVDPVDSSLCIMCRSSIIRSVGFDGRHCCVAYHSLD